MVQLRGCSRRHTEQSRDDRQACDLAHVSILAGRHNRGMDRRAFLQRVAGAAAIGAVPQLARSSPTDPRVASLAKAVRGPVLAPGTAAYDSARQVFDSHV